jgi:hypothetical protein
MRKILFFCFLFFGNISVFAFVDEIYVYEESNTLFQIQTGNSKSKEQQILKTYIQLINNFVREIDSIQTVFIQFDQQDYYCDYSFYTLSYGTFSEFALYGKIPYPNSKVISKNFDHDGIIIYFSNNFLKLKPLLQLIEFGLKNKNKINKNQQFIENMIDTTRFIEDRSSHLEVMYKNMVSHNLNSHTYFRINNKEINSILNNPVSQIQSDYLSIRTSFPFLYSELSDNKYDLYFQNDSCYIENNNGDVIRLENIYGIRFVKQQNSLFIFDSQESFIFANSNTQTNTISPKLPFKIDCFQGMCFTVLSVLFDNERNKFKIQLTCWIDPYESNKIYPYCFYDTETNALIY